MRFPLKPLDEQVIVITGASSGIGLVTAKHAARRGARVVLAARNEQRPARRDAKTFAGRRPRQCTPSPTWRIRRRSTPLPTTAIREFGRIDTWVNNAAVSMYGRIMDLSIDDMRRQMDVNYWGQVYGSRRPCGTSVRPAGRSSTWQRAGGSRHPAARRLLRGEARAQGVHRRAPDGARGSRAFRSR